MFRYHISSLEVKCATSALGRASVLPASCVFSPANPQIFFFFFFFFVGWPGDGVRAVVIYPVHVWRRRDALDSCNSGMFMFC